MYTFVCTRTNYILGYKEPCVQADVDDEKLTNCTGRVSSGSTVVLDRLSNNTSVLQVISTCV